MWGGRSPCMVRPEDPVGGAAGGCAAAARSMGGTMTATEPTTALDAVIIGAGFSGLYTLHKLRDEMGLNARVIEAGGGVGGTWWWNRYPGARSDSDSYIYGFMFDEELWKEWQWSERYPEQHEVRAYL